MSNSLIPFGSNKLPFDEAEIMEIESKRKSIYPSNEKALAFVCTRIVESRYVFDHQIIHTSGERFSELVNRFIELLTNTEENGISRNYTALQLKKLRELKDDMERSLKDAIKVKHFDFFINWQKRYGLFKYHNRICWGSQQEEIVRNLGRAKATMLEEGYEGFQYSLQDYVDLHAKYENLVKRGYITESASMSVASKNEIRAELEKLLRCIVYNIKCNYYDTWEHKAIDIGFLKVRN